MSPRHRRQRLWYAGRRLLAASGVIAIVLGLALQSTLGDVFSGVVLNLAKPYHPGDWIILDERVGLICIKPKSDKLCMRLT